MGAAQCCAQTGDKPPYRSLLIDDLRYLQPAVSSRFWSVEASSAPLWSPYALAEARLLTPASCAHGMLAGMRLHLADADCTGDRATSESIHAG